MSPGWCKYTVYKCENIYKYSLWLGWIQILPLKNDTSWSERRKKITAGIVKVILSMLQDLSFLSAWWSLSSGCQVTEQGAAPDLSQLSQSVNPEQGCAITRWQVPFLFFLPGGSGCLDWPLKPHTHQQNMQAHMYGNPHTPSLFLLHTHLLKVSKGHFEYGRNVVLHAICFVLLLFFYGRGRSENLRRNLDETALHWRGWFLRPCQTSWWL